MNKKVINIFGDSITEGYNAKDQNGWVEMLKEELKDFEVNNLGVNGDCTKRVLKRFLTENKNQKPDVILISIGTNDSAYTNFKNNPTVSLEEFEANLQKIIKKGREFTKDIIFVGLGTIEEKKLMPTPWISTLYYDNENIKKYNSKIKEICEKNSLLFIDMDGVLELKDLEDGLHPNDKGHEKMFQRIKDFLIESKIFS